MSVNINIFLDKMQHSHSANSMSKNVVSVNEINNIVESVKTNNEKLYYDTYCDISSKYLQNDIRMDVDSNTECIIVECEIGTAKGKKNIYGNIFTIGSNMNNVVRIQDNSISDIHVIIIKVLNDLIIINADTNYNTYLVTPSGKENITQKILTFTPNERKTITFGNAKGTFEYIP